MSKAELERRIEQIVKQELRGSALYLASGASRGERSFTMPVRRGGDMEYEGSNDAADNMFTLTGDRMFASGKKKRQKAGALVHMGNHRLGGLMMADGKKPKGKARGDGGKALEAYRAKLDHVRRENPHKSYRECQQIAKDM